MAQGILIVDDEPYILRILSFKLRREGYVTYEAQSAEEAWEVFHSASVDLMVLDVGLATATSGFDLAESLRQHAGTRDLPIILLTARNLSEDFRRGRRLGAVGYVTKPFSTADLIERIRTVLQ